VDPATVAEPVEETRRTGQGAAHREDIVRYYSEAGQDYGSWSRNFHMHFGYYRAGLNPFALEGLLAEMSRQVLARLQLGATAPVRVLDLGCGLGATTRLAAAEHPGWNVHGLTIVPWQLEQARQLTAGKEFSSRVQFIQGDYTASPFSGAAYDGLYAIESACHDAGYEKAGFVKEAARIVKPGGRLVIADGFQKGLQPMSPPLRWAFDKVCRNWALESFAELGVFLRGLEREGFVIESVEDASFRIVPSVAHIPRVTLRHLAKELIASRLRLGKVRWGHLLACVLSPFVGMARHRFGYYLVTARRRHDGEETIRTGSGEQTVPD
jgi:ubiquinone/menaquinone biosynthesis C-methylase UbiE